MLRTLQRSETDRWELCVVSVAHEHVFVAASRPRRLDVNRFGLVIVVGRHDPTKDFNVLKKFICYCGIIYNNNYTGVYFLSSKVFIKVEKPMR